MKKFFFIIFILLFSANSEATNIYVDKDPGTDCSGNYSISSRNCSGSDGNSYDTIQEAINVADDGDIVFIREDTYSECLDIVESGSEGSPITIQNYNSESVIIDGSGCGANPIIDWDIGGPGYDWVVISGLEVKDGSKYGIWIEGNHNTITNCKVHDMGYPGETGGACGITVMRSSYTTISENEVYNTGWNGISFGDGIYGVVTKNLIYNCPYHVGINAFPNQSDPEENNPGNDITFNKIYSCKHGIYSRNQTYYEIRNNLIYDINKESGSGGYGIWFDYYIAGGWSSTYAGYGEIYNNTVYDTENYPVYNTAATCLTFKNNILSNSGGSRAISTNRTTGIVLDYNLYYSPTSIYWNGSVYSDVSTFYSGTGNEEHGINDNPDFIIPGSDFTLQSGSPCIDTGDDSYDGLDPTATWPDSVSTLNQADYGAGPEIGPYVYVPYISEASPPNNATGVSLTVDLTWTNPTGTTSIDLLFDKNTNPPEKKKLDDQNVETWDCGTLDENSDYYWRVDVNHDGGTETGTVYKFTTTSGPPPDPSSQGTIKYSVGGIGIVRAPSGGTIK